MPRVAKARLTDMPRPIIGCLYILNYIDRQALAATRVYGIMDDLGMTEAQFATAISILFGRSSPNKRVHHKARQD